MSDIRLTIIDRHRVEHEVDAPTDMNMNVMELVRVYELAPEGTIGVCGGMAMCASCQCYVLSDHSLPHPSDEEEARILETALDGQGQDAPRFHEGALDVDLAKLEPKVGPGDLIQLWLEAVDNRPEEPNRGRSRTLNIRIEGGDAEEERQSTEDADTAIDVDDTQEMTLEEEPGKPSTMRRPGTRSRSG